MITAKAYKTVMFLRISVFVLAAYVMTAVAKPPDHQSKEIEEIFKHYEDHLCPHIDNIDCSHAHVHHDGHVCASNLVTYPTHCDFVVAHCKNKTLLVRNEGPCDVITGGNPSGIVYTRDELKAYHHRIDEVFKTGHYDGCPLLANFDCTQQEHHHDETLCASDMKIYQGHCVFAKAKCNDHSLTVRHQGPCDVIAPVNQTGVDPAFAVIKGVFCKNINLITCGTAIDDPICGDDGVLYSSQCLFSKTKCFKANLEATDMSICSKTTTVASSTLAAIIAGGSMDNN